MPNESKIRDLLAARLSVLEPGLVHIETEHKLPNDLGSKGSVDILASDPAGHRVIIELKRSDAAARSAIHELCKYVALFKAEHGLPDHRLRCFVVSTQWRELLVPFAEFVRASNFQVEGFELRIAADGTPLSATRITCPPESEMVDLFRHHDILLYETSARRDGAARAVADHALASGATAAFVCLLDSAEPESIPYPYALYSVVGGVEPIIRERIEAELKAEYETDDLDSINPIMVEEDFSRRLLKDLAWACDTYEIGYPDKLTSTLRSGWTCRSILRRGRMTSTAVVSDEELLALMQGLDGPNTIIYERVASPRVPRSWTHFLESAGNCLRGNPAWERSFRLFARLIEARYPAGLISAKIYNPLHVPLSLLELVTDANSSYLPAMEIVCSQDGNAAVVLMGFLTWKGTEPIGSIGELLEGIAGSGFEYLTLHHFGQAWEVDDELTRRLGLEYEAFVLQTKAGSTSETSVLVEVQGAVSLEPYTPSADAMLTRYMNTNGELMKILAQEFASASFRADVGHRRQKSPQSG